MAIKYPDDQFKPSTFPPTPSIATLVPTKSDQEMADTIRNELVEAYKPIIEILTAAKKEKFDVMISTGADGFGRVHLMEIKIVKNY